MFTYQHTWLSSCFSSCSLEVSTVLSCLSSSHPLDLGVLWGLVLSPLFFTSHPHSHFMLKSHLKALNTILPTCWWLLHFYLQPRPLKPHISKYQFIITIWMSNKLRFSIPKVKLLISFLTSSHLHPKTVPLSVFISGQMAAYFLQLLSLTALESSLLLCFSCISHTICQKNPIWLHLQCIPRVRPLVTTATSATLVQHTCVSHLD